jgi:hypothetical protein
VVHRDRGRADMRVDGSIGPAIRTGRDLSGRERAERRLSADLANQTHAGAQCGAALFGREKILPDADWHARIGRGERARIAREFERHALTQAYTVPILW